MYMPSSPEVCNPQLPRASLLPRTRRSAPPQPPRHHGRPALASMRHRNRSAPSPPPRARRPTLPQLSTKTTPCASSVTPPSSPHRSRLRPLLPSWKSSCSCERVPLAAYPQLYVGLLRQVLLAARP
jgi:hypothetical protein